MTFFFCPFLPVLEATLVQALEAQKQSIVRKNFSYHTYSVMQMRSSGNDGVGEKKINFNDTQIECLYSDHDGYQRGKQPVVRLASSVTHAADDKSTLKERKRN